MKDDPTIVAIREARHKISASIDHDPSRLVEHYRALQKRHRERLVFHDSGTSKYQDKNVVLNLSEGF